MNLSDATETLIWIYAVMQGWILIAGGLLASLLVATTGQSQRRAAILALLQLTPVFYVLSSALVSGTGLDQLAPAGAGPAETLIVVAVVMTGPMALIVHAWLHIARSAR